jgi:splicing factor 1
VRNQLMKERQDLLAETVKRVPGFQVPMGLKVDTRIVRKLFIPVDKYPDYNFIGLIIGPRGTTQKRMEKETGAKIAIRGRGSVKMGRRADGKPLPSESEDLHVLITGDRQEDVDRACAMVEKLLIPVEEGLNEHKALQLRELAMYNGTLREEVVCRMCGDRGHRMVDCPQRTSSWKPANVLCGICGANTHPTIDCPRKGQANAAAEINKLEEEFDSFMAEVQGSGSSAPVAATKSAPLALPAPAAPPPPLQQQMQQPSMFEAPGPAAAPRSESPDGEEMVIDTPQPVSLPTAPGFAPAHFGAARPGFAPTPFGAPPPPPFGPYGAPPPFGAPPPPFGRPPPFGFAPPPAPFMGFRGAPPPPQQQQQPPQPPQPPQ